MMISSDCVKVNNAFDASDELKNAIVYLDNKPCTNFNNELVACYAFKWQRIRASFR